MPLKIIRDGLALVGIAVVLAVSDPATPGAERWPATNADAAAIEPSSTPPFLAPTIHPPVARELATLWMVPSDAERSAHDYRIGMHSENV